jgi:hypothetical protein
VSMSISWPTAFIYFVSGFIFLIAGVLVIIKLFPKRKKESVSVAKMTGDQILNECKIIIDRKIDDLRQEMSSRFCTKEEMASRFNNLDVMMAGMRDMIKSNGQPVKEASREEKVLDFLINKTGPGKPAHLSEISPGSSPTELEAVALALTNLWNGEIDEHKNLLKSRGVKLANLGHDDWMVIKDESAKEIAPSPAS